MLLKYLETVTLKRVQKTKQPNGTSIETYQEIGDYQVQKQELDDEISANIYGANIVNMLRIKTPLATLERILATKVNNKTDNISKYYIFVNKPTIQGLNSVLNKDLNIESNKYKIKSVNSKGIDIELV